MVTYFIKLYNYIKKNSQNLMKLKRRGGAILILELFLRGQNTPGYGGPV